jgi:DNA-binding transcriptional ArsR family regulator
MTYDLPALAAVADPTRRRVLELVAERPRSVAEITRALPVSQPAVSQHLKVLKTAGLVRAVPDGARNVYHLDPHGLAEMRAWLDRMWDGALRAFAADCNTEEET